METKKLSETAMKLSWQFIRKNGLPRSEALRIAWINAKLMGQMKNRVVAFAYKKTDGSIRQASGTLRKDILPATRNAVRRPDESLFAYFDTGRGGYRSFKKVNLIRME